MKIKTIFLLSIEGIKNIKGNISISISAFIITYICFLIFTLFTILNINVDKNLKKIEREPEIEIFLQTDVTSAEKQILENFLNKQEFIVHYTMISKEEAYNRFIQMTGNTSEELDVEKYGIDIFPESYVVDINKTEIIDEFIEELKKIEQIESISYSRELTEFINSFSLNIRKAMRLIISSLAIFAFLIHFNMIKVSVNIRKNEIDLIKMLGAKNCYITLPFIVEGVIITFVSALATYVTSIVLYNHVISIFSKYIRTSIYEFFIFEDSKSIGTKTAFYLFILTFVFAIISSTIATYINLKNERENGIGF